MQPGYDYTDAQMIPDSYWDDMDDVDNQAHNNVLERITDQKADGAQEVIESLVDLFFNAKDGFKQELVNWWIKSVAKTISGEFLGTEFIDTRAVILAWYETEKKKEVLEILDSMRR